MPVLFLSWGDLAPNGTTIEGTPVYDAGGVNVAVNVVGNTAGDAGTVTDIESYVDADDPFSPTSHLKLSDDGVSPTSPPTPADVSTTTLDFTASNPRFADAVNNVTFRISDIDSAPTNDFDGGSAPRFEDVVTIRAFDAEGNAIPVTLTPGTNVTTSGATATGTGDANQQDAANSLLVDIAGPVSRVEIEYDNGGVGEQFVVLSDVYFETLPSQEENPDAVDDAVRTAQDDPIVIAVLENDSDPQDDPLTVSSVTVPENGTAAINADGTVTYTPAEGFTGTDTFDYTIIDGNGGTDTATVTVVVNAAPDAVDDTASTPLDTPITVPVLDNDSDPDGDPLTITQITEPANGSAVLNDDGTITYTPADGFEGEDTIVYTVSDGNGGTDTAELTITVGTDGNAPPVARDDAVETLPAQDIVIPVLANDSDPDGDPVRIVSVEDPANGSVSLTDDGTGIIYTPDDGFTGTDQFDYTIEDPDGAMSTATVTVAVGQGRIDTDIFPVDPSLQAIDPFNGFDEDPDPADDLDAVTGTAGADVIVTGDDADTISALAGDDTILSGIDDDLVDGGAGDDLIEDVQGADTIDGGAGNDTINAGANTFSDYAGDDTFFGPGALGETLGFDRDPNQTDGRDLISGGTGNDVIFTGDDRDTIDGGADDDTIDGGIDDDSILGGDGDDEIIGSHGSDIIDGGAGSDLIDARNFEDLELIDDNGPDSDPVPENDRDSVLGGSGDDTILTGDDADTILGGAGNDLIDAGIDDDSVLGEDGADTIVSGQGSDFVSGGGGDDLIDTRNSADREIPGADDPFFADDLDTVLGGDGDDTILTGDDGDVIDGGDGADDIDAGIDDDIVSGGDGADTILAGQGNDTVDGGSGDDVIGGNLPNDPALIDGVDPDEQNDMDSLIGGDGNDTLIGGDDRDTLEGGAGDDVLDGGIDDDSLEGGEGADDLIAGQGNDTLLGGAGNDTLTGGAGTDVIDGGADRDTIVIDGAGDGIGDTITGGATGDDFDRLDLTGAGERGTDWRLVDARTDSDGNGIDGTIEFLDGAGDPTGGFDFTNIEEIVPCFTPGTTIATPTGERLVEDLREGDRVITRDNGLQEIRWVGQKALTGHQLARAPHLRPILIQAGSLGPNLPEHDMLVSPNHRVLVSNDKTSLYFEEREVLAAAKHLVGLPGIREVGTLGVTYVHFLCDQHEVVLSNGAWTESFQPGDVTMSGMGNAQRTEIYELFPELKTRAGLNGYTAARRSLKRHEARLLTS